MIELALALALSSVRPELVERRSPLQREGRPSTSSGRTEQEPRTALEAERAFAADAQKIGQWSAFRKWAAADAMLFTPQPTRAQDWLKDRQEPAKSVEWWPTTSWVSCDGPLAVNTGGSRWPNGSLGFFTTVWQWQPDGKWRWLVDHGDQIAVARPAPFKPATRIGACQGAGRAPTVYGTEDGGASAAGQSEDGTLQWQWGRGQKRGEKSHDTFVERHHVVDRA